MNQIIDRFLLLGGCFIYLLGVNHDYTAVVAFLGAITVSALNGLVSSGPFAFATVFAYLVASSFSPSFLFFLPLVFYDLFLSVYINKNKGALVLSALGFVQLMLRLPLQAALMVTLMILFAHIFASRTQAVAASERRMRRLRDDSWEMTMLLKEKNRELLERQGYGMRMAKLSERSRIAREIHDHVGHLLSRCILQVGALLVGEERKQTRSDLAAVHSTLAEAMERIRTSVHGLYEESLDFRVQIETLAEEFTFCPLRLDYKLETEPSREIQHCFLAVIKEGLHNVVRHSNGSQVIIALLEHPALYQLVLQDNGTKFTAAPARGLGLTSMADRAEALGGRLLIEREGGFRLFISIPKGVSLGESASN